MKKNAHVIIIERDPYARSMMEMLLVKDWSVHVLGLDSTVKAILPVLIKAKKHNKPVDMILCNLNLLSEIVPYLESDQIDVPIIFLVDRYEDLSVLTNINVKCCTVIGMLMKEEILFSLGYAVSYALAGYWVKTSTISWKIENIFRLNGQPMVILDGKHITATLTPSEDKMARYALIYSVERKDIADEGVLSENSVYTAIYDLYKKLGVEDILLDPDYMGALKADEPVLAKPFLRLISAEDMTSTKKKKMRETLAFHYMCMPDVNSNYE